MRLDEHLSNTKCAHRHGHTHPLEFRDYPRKGTESDDEVCVGGRLYLSVRLTCLLYDTCCAQFDGLNGSPCYLG